jgi:hypothetical protein
MALEENIITWNVANWISVTIMAAIGFGLLGLAQKLWSAKQQGEQQ